MDTFQALGNTLNARMTGVAQSRQIDNAELGTITDDYGLALDSYKTPVPKGAYMVSKRLFMRQDKIEVTTESSGGGTYSHSHAVDISIPAELIGLEPGNRVLVIWAGTEPIVIDIIQDSGTL